MSIHLHHLTGCAPAPLAHYLKAIGILRIASEQADKQARGWWQDEHFCLLTTLNRFELEAFFLERYEPTPFLSPWNKGSGFFKDNDPGLEPLEESESPRFKRYRYGIEKARFLLDQITDADAAIRAIKARTKTNQAFQSPEQRTILQNSPAYVACLKELRKQLEKNDVTPEQEKELLGAIAAIEYLTADASGPPTKAEANRLKNSPGYKRVLATAERQFKLLKRALIPNCRRTWRGPHAEWMAAAVVLDENGNESWPSLLGTGGNDGNLDFTNNSMQRIADLFDLADPSGGARDGTAALLRHALWLDLTNELTDKAKIGQFMPGSAGGANCTNAPDGNGLVNPWDYVLMLEGSILFNARATRRLEPNELSRASSPFVVRSHAAGYSSPGAEKASRGEQWMPIWSRPSTFGDLAGLLGEGRLQLGRRIANRPVDVARAISRLGVARGINAFTRYGYLERNGQSNIAVPLGRIYVRHHPRSHLIDDIAPWMNRLQRLARDKNAPARLIHAERRLADTVFAVLTHDDSPDRWQAVLCAAVALEAVQAAGTAISAGPIPTLSKEWVKAVDDRSPELRLALSLGSAAAGYSREGRPFDSVRHHWLPLERGARRFRVSEKRLAKDSRVVMTGRDASADCFAVVERRLIEAAMNGRRKLPLVAARGSAARLSDLALLLGGTVDLTRVIALARAFMALRWGGWAIADAPSSPRSGEMPDEAWLALRLACLPWPLDDGHNVPAEPSIIRRLIAGDGSGAVNVALSRLSASGFRPPLQAAVTDPHTARLWAAALVFPIDRVSARRAAAVLDPNLLGDRNV